jgi:hypothetical protein
MANCLDVVALYQQVVLDEREDVLQYGQSSFQTLLDFMKNCLKHIKIDNILLNDQYLEWKKRCLRELKDKDNWNVWTKDDQISTTKVMKTFFMNKNLANGIEQFLHFYSLMVVKIRSEAVCESVASILKQHIRGNRALDHESLDKEVMLHWNASPLHLADPFIKSCLNNYFSQLKDKHWIFLKKNRTASSIQISFTWFSCFEPLEKRTSRKNSYVVRTVTSRTKCCHVSLLRFCVK